MVKADIDPLKKHTMFLFDGDLARLAELVPGVPPSTTVRHLVRAYITKLEGARPHIKIEDTL